MPVSVEVRGVTATLEGDAVSFACNGDPIPSAIWDGPKGVDKMGQPKSRVSLPNNFQETGFADAVALALEGAVP